MRYSKLKLFTLCTIGLLALIVIAQNTETVETRFLFLTITMSRAGLLALTFIVGYLAGVMSFLVLARPQDAKSRRIDT